MEFRGEIRLHLSTRMYFSSHKVDFLHLVSRNGTRNYTGDWNCVCVENDNLTFHEAFDLTMWIGLNRSVNGWGEITKLFEYFMILIEGG